MKALTPLNELVGFERFKRTQITKELDWNRTGYWTNKIDKDHRRAPGKFCGDCVVELTEIPKSRNTSAHLKCNECGKEIGKVEVVEATQP